MDCHARLGAMRATARWTFYGTPPATRRFQYRYPNHFRITSVSPDLIGAESCCDGRSQIDTMSVSHNAYNYTIAPEFLYEPNLGYLASPMLCGSPLFALFAGRKRLQVAADTRQERVRFGRTVTIRGQQCRTVRYLSPGAYGHVSAAIRISDGMVMRFKYDNAGLLQASGDDIRSTLTEAEAAADETRAALNEMLTPANMLTTEEYVRIRANGHIPLRTFRIRPKIVRQEVDLSGSPLPIGQPAPDITLPTTSGEIWSLEAQRGSIVLVKFFATWCAPCRESMPGTQRLWEEYAAKGLRVLAITDESEDAAREYMSEAGYTIPVGLDMANDVHRRYGIATIPAVAIIDAEGRLAAFFHGRNDADEVRAALDCAGLPHSADARARNLLT
jgi:peroxiredoxin